jgi:hypothetical protein
MNRNNLQMGKQMAKATKGDLEQMALLLGVAGILEDDDDEEGAVGLSLTSEQLEELAEIFEYAFAEGDDDDEDEYFDEDEA